MYIGVDLGTSSVKCILTTTTGDIVKTVSREYELLLPNPSWCEQDPIDWYNQTIAALKELVTGYESSIKGMGFSGQMHSLVILDNDDNILRNAILWNDQRTTKEVAYLNDTIGINKLIQLNGNIALTGLTAPKILWIRSHEPEIFKRINKIMLPKDYLIYKLTGQFVSDVTDMSGTLFFDPRTKTYSQELCAILGINTKQLPRVHESHEIIGFLTPQTQQLLGITSQVSVSVGGGDQAVGAVGVGVVRDGECSISLGTSGVIFVSSDEFVVDQVTHFQSYAHANGKYHIMAVMLNAASAIKWWNETVLNSDDYADFYEKLQDSSVQENLFFLPYLSGERAPINDSNARGVLFGLGLHHKEKDINRAIVEGVTFALRDSLELIREIGVPIIEVRVTGGGSKSSVWAQLIADILNVQVVKVLGEESPALGAAILSMVGNNEYPSVEEACNTIVQTDTCFHPIPKSVTKYNKKYSQFKMIYPIVKPLFKSISSD